MNFTDPSGEIPLDIILDIGFVAYDIGALAIDEVFNDGANREEHLASLGANVVGMGLCLTLPVLALPHGWAMM